MEITEPIESINQLLKEHYGVDTVTGEPIWRIVWSEDQFEHRLGTYEDVTPSGIFIREVTEVRYVPKYRQWIHEKFVLERLVVVPEQDIETLAGAKTSYEPIYVFETVKNEYLPPKFIAAKWVIDCIYAVQYGSDHSLKRYRDPESTQEESLELQKKRVDEIVEALWGDQSSLAGGTRAGDTVIVPQNYNSSVAVKEN